MYGSFQTPNLAQPDQGSAVIGLSLDFTTQTTVVLDLTKEIEQGVLDFMQSVYVDNADNSGPIDLVFLGGPVPYRVRVQPFWQGWFPITWPKGAARLQAFSNSGAKINVFFGNMAMPYYVAGPTPGITVVPPLTNEALNVLAIGAGASVQLVPGVANETVKLYRGIFEVDGQTVLRWTDGNGGAALFTAFLVVGGSATFDVSGIPWFNTSTGNGLFLSSTVACNIYGGFGYVQS